MNTTIAAISTAVSASGIGIIRISGPEAMDVISRIYRSKGGKKKIKEVPTHTIHYGYIYDGEEAVDEVLVMVMRAPKTFTGEDTVEIDCHGGVYAMNRVLETVLKNGAKIAGPGEFTKRAFLNGRLDLSGGVYYSSWNYAENCGYGRYPRDRGCGGENRCFQGTGGCKGCRSGVIRSRQLYTA